MVKIGPNLSEVDVRTFARINKVIWDQLLATKAEIIHGKLYFQYFHLRVERYNEVKKIIGQDKLVSRFPFVCRFVARQGHFFV